MAVLSEVFNPAQRAAWRVGSPIWLTAFTPQTVVVADQATHVGCTPAQPTWGAGLRLTALGAVTKPVSGLVGVASLSAVQNR